LERITVIVMGRYSYEQILTFGEWAWPDKQTYVFTSQNLTTSRSDIKFVKGNIKFFVETIKGNSSNGDIWLLGGAEMVKSFAKEKLIDECIITVVPFSIGSGIKLELPLDEFVFVSEKSCIDNLIQRHYMRKNL
jgi:dihydrofolate reductase